MLLLARADAGKEKLARVFALSRYRTGFKPTEARAESGRGVGEEREEACDIFSISDVTPLRLYNTLMSHGCPSMYTSMQKPSRVHN